MTDAAIQIEIRARRGLINLRCDPGNGVFLENVEETLGQPLPLNANTFTDRDQVVYWLGPDEFLVICAAADTVTLCKRLSTALKETHFAINDLSGGHVTIMLRGEAVPDVLSKGCTLDLHPDAFPAGACAQTGLGKAGVLIASRKAEFEYDVIVRRSFSDYLVRWLRHAAAS